MNPTGQPMGIPQPSAPSSAAKDAVNVPSLIIIILGGLGAILFVIGMINALTGGSLRMAEALIPSLPPEQQEIFRKALTRSSGSVVWGIIQSMVGLAFAGFTIFGGLQMRELKNYGVAIAAAIIAMTPCATSCCYCLGFPVGIWALVVLTKPEVKSAFT